VLGVGSLLENIEGVEATEVVVAISNRFDELERRMDGLEAGQMVSDEGIILLTLSDRLSELEQRLDRILDLLV
jgi:hypothetical protein